MSVESELKLATDESNGLYDYLFHQNEYTGWNFGSGNPEFWKFQDQMLVPGGKLLDIGIRDGRSSIFFALHGMEITGVDPDTRAFEDLTYIANDLDLNMQLVPTELSEAGLEDESFDTVLLDYTLMHQQSRADAYRVIDLAYAKLKSGGHMWLRASGIDDSRRRELEHSVSLGRISSTGLFNRPIAYDGALHDDGHVIEHPCDCSGEVRQECSLFFDQLDLPIIVTQMGAKIIHSQVIPLDGAENVMFGEDFKPDLWIIKSGTVSVLAQKPQM